MPKNNREEKTKVETAKDIPENVKLDEQKLNMLLKEYDSLRDMLSQTETGLRNILNSYLTILSLVVGGVVLITQLSASASIAISYSQLTVSGLLFFSGVIGTVYSMSSAGIYADLVRYASCLDELRRFLIHKLNVPIPITVYNPLLSAESIKKDEPRLVRIISLFMPVGFVQLFVSATTSISFAVATCLILISSYSVSDSLNRSFIVFGLSFVAFNVFSRVSVYSLGARYGVAFNTGRNLFPLFKRK